MTTPHTANDAPSRGWRLAVLWCRIFGHTWDGTDSWFETRPHGSGAVTHETVLRRHCLICDQWGYTAAGRAALASQEARDE